MSEHDKGTSIVRRRPPAPPSVGETSSASSIPRGKRLGGITAFACILILLLSTTTPAFASGAADPTAVVVDVVVTRPVSFAVTAVGTVLFVVSLPFAAASHSVNTTSEALVAGPARDLFTRPVGDLEDWLSY